MDDRRQAKALRDRPRGRRAALARRQSHGRHSFESAQTPSSEGGPQPASRERTEGEDRSLAVEARCSRPADSPALGGRGRERGTYSLRNAMKRARTTAPAASFSSGFTNVCSAMRTGGAGGDCAWGGRENAPSHSSLATMAGTRRRAHPTGARRARMQRKGSPGRAAARPRVAPGSEGRVGRRREGAPRTSHAGPPSPSRALRSPRAQTPVPRAGAKACTQLRSSSTS